MIPMSPAQVYGKSHLCPECGVRPSMTQPDYDMKFRTYDQDDGRTKLIIYGQRPTNNRLCYFCSREVTRYADNLIIEEKRRSTANKY